MSHQKFEEINILGIKLQKYITKNIYFKYIISFSSNTLHKY